MSTQLIVGSARLYVVTDDGRAAASAEDSCDCEYRWTVGLLVCSKCGTGVGVGRNSDYRRMDKAN